MHALSDDILAEESDILTTCALRFDGYKYREDTQLDQEKVLDEFFESGCWPDSPMIKMTVFFLLQRYLMKWGGEYLPLHGRHWRAFRELFLLTCTMDIPAVYRFQEYNERWNQTYASDLERIVKRMEWLHHHIAYDDQAGPELNPDGLHVPLKP